MSSVIEEVDYFLFRVYVSKDFGLIYGYGEVGFRILV